MTTGGARATFGHPWRIVAVALVGGAVAWLLAVRDPISAWELDVSRWLNGAPDPVAGALYPVMQLGTLAAPVLLAVGVLVVKRDVAFAAAAVVGGVIAWFGAKAVKDLVDRGRPVAFLPDIDVREPSAKGAGFISGHSAVAMFSMVMLMAVVPARWRPVLVALAVLVGIARIVSGVHLPADVLGGWALGALIGVGAVAAVDRVRAGRDAAPAETAAAA